jgi:signal transduction histidine kinase
LLGIALSMPGVAQRPDLGADTGVDGSVIGATAAQVLRDMADGVAVVDGNGRVTWANPALSTALGGGRLSGVGLADLFEVTQPPELSEIVTRTQRGAGWRGCLRRKGADPETGVWEATLSPVGCGSGSEPGLLVAVLRDVSERHAAEQRRVDFLSMVTHDIKGPLTVILGYAELLSDPEESPSPAVVLDMLGRIRESGEQIHALVSNFIELSRIEAGRLELEFMPLDLTELVDDVVSRHASRATRKGIEVQRDLVPLPEMSGDRPHLERAVLNLFGNAIKFTPGGGRVTVSTRMEGRCAVVAVSDTGPGIAPEDLDDIFKKYRRAPAAGRVEGTGLGLFIARTVIQAHRGDIRVETAVGEGSTFTVVLPLDS